MKHILLTPLALLLMLLIASCDPATNLRVFKDRMFHKSIKDFEKYWLSDHAITTGLSVPQVKLIWKLGSKGLDTVAAKNGYWDLSTDFCSKSPDTGLWFDFKAACTRHDYGYRNLKPGPKKRWGNWKLDNKHNRQQINNQFLKDMVTHCSGRGWLYKKPCKDTAVLYYLVVKVNNL